MNKEEIRSMFEKIGYPKTKDEWESACSLAISMTLVRLEEKVKGMQLDWGDVNSGNCSVETKDEMGIHNEALEGVLQATEELKK